MRFIDKNTGKELKDTYEYIGIKEGSAPGKVIFEAKANKKVVNRYKVKPDVPAGRVWKSYSEIYSKRYTK